MRNIRFLIIFILFLSGTSINVLAGEDSQESHPIFVEKTNFQADLVLKKVEYRLQGTVIGHGYVIELGGQKILDADSESSSGGFKYEGEARFADRTHVLISEHIDQCNVYRVITIREKTNVHVSEKFGKCFDEPEIDKYEDGSMDIIFSEWGGAQSKVHIDANNKIIQPSFDQQWEEWKKRPGVHLTKAKSADGKENETLTFPGNVDFTRYADGHILSVDNTPQGSVMCSWHIYIHMLAQAESCDVDQSWRDSTKDAVERINQFIIENSLSSLTKEGVNKETEKQLKESKKHFESDRARQCKSGMANMSGKVDKVAFKKTIDELLAIPRPPVINPCM